jgi:hypothetical protein
VKHWGDSYQILRALDARFERRFWVVLLAHGSISASAADQAPHFTHQRKCGANGILNLGQRMNLLAGALHPH